MKPSEVVDILADMEAAWRDMTPEKKKLYAEDLLHLNADTTRAAVRTLVRVSRWLPTIAEIRAEEREERGVHPDVQGDLGYLALEAGELEAMTPEQREKFERVKALLKEKPIGRVYPAAFDDMPDEVFKPEAYRLPTNALCPGSREVGKRKGRHLVCGLCGDDMDPECVPVLRKERNCVALSRSESAL